MPCRSRGIRPAPVANGDLKAEIWLAFELLRDSIRKGAVNGCVHEPEDRDHNDPELKTENDRERDHRCWHGPYRHGAKLGPKLSDVVRTARRIIAIAHDSMIAAATVVTA